MNRTRTTVYRRSIDVRTMQDGSGLWQLKSSSQNENPKSAFSSYNICRDHFGFDEDELNNIE